MRRGVPVKSLDTSVTHDDRHERVIAKVFDSTMTDIQRAAMKDLDEHAQKALQAFKPHRRVQIIKLSADE